MVQVMAENYFVENFPPISKLEVEYLQIYITDHYIDGLFLIYLNDHYVL